jgi:para-aminobenzoate synthetase component 1
VAVNLPGFSIRPADERLGEWTELLSSRTAAPPPPRAFAPLAAPEHSLTWYEYLARTAQAKRYIAAGDIFQVNLTRRESYPAHEPAINIYRRLRRDNPAEYAAFLSWPDDSSPCNEAAIVSASPELFLRLEGRQVTTRPIKGTRERSADPLVDAARREELIASEKDRAELAMIVDLERNDLGRVCDFGSICVGRETGPLASTGLAEDGRTHWFEVETHPTVHHLVATIRGRLADGFDGIDLLQACFPGGSITGAPKVRAMEIIDELEPTQRGVYTGAIGCFSLHGAMAFNIAIRTLVVAGGRVHLNVGGGIVADSVPEDEYRETEAKALALRRALGSECRHETRKSIRELA